MTMRKVQMEQRSSRFPWLTGEMELRQHPLVKDPDDQDITAHVAPEEDDVLALLEAPILRAGSIHAASRRICGKIEAARLDLG